MINRMIGQKKYWLRLKNLAPVFRNLDPWGPANPARAKTYAQIAEHAGAGTSENPNVRGALNPQPKTPEKEQP